MQKIIQQTMIELNSDYNSYILNEDNMLDYLKYKINVKKTTVKEYNIKTTHKPINNHVNKPSFFIPKENDSLFWCYYIISNGDVNYETINNKNTVITKQIKINLVNKIRENKQTVKIYKFDTISNIESNLANDDNINIKTILTLCAVEKINVIFVRNKTYYELLMNDTDPIYIIREMQITNNNYVKKYGYEVANSDKVEEIRKFLYKLDNPNKPIKSLSSYKVLDLTEICNKLAIELINKETGKHKTKNELYESIIQYF
jgi:hypothetical protein